ncbi:MAG: hypothetical protein ACRC2K_05630 [Clostridium sp.]
MKKKVLCICFLGLFLLIISCSNKKLEESSNIDLKIAHDVANSYMQKLYEGDVEGAKMLLTKDLKKSTKAKEIQGLRLTSFKEIEEVETATYITTRYKVTRAEEGTPRSTVDLYKVKIVLEKGEYKVSEATAENLKNVYGEGETLRVRRDNEGDSELLIRLKDLPNDIYIKDEGAQINKYDLPNKAFGVIGMGNTGSKIGITTTNGTDTYVAIVIDEETKQSFATASLGGGQSGEDKKTIDEVIEKPVAQQLNSIDLIRNASVQKIQFDGKEEKIIVQYKEKDRGENLKLYNSSSGDLITLDLDKKFPNDIYNVHVSKIDGEEIFIKVNLIDGGEDEKVGTYKLECDKLEVIKE